MSQTDHALPRVFRLERFPARVPSLQNSVSDKADCLVRMCLSIERGTRVLVADVLCMLISRGFAGPPSSCVTQQPVRVQAAHPMA